MKRLWTIIGVADVARSLDWYQSLLDRPKAPPNHDYFGQIATMTAPFCYRFMHGASTIIRRLDAPPPAAPGNGLILFFRVDNFDQALLRAQSLVDTLEDEPDTNPATGTREFALRDPDGYYVMVSALD